jgi:diguanylate cyclase (GGDEF)-like protein
VVDRPGSLVSGAAHAGRTVSLTTTRGFLSDWLRRRLLRLTEPQILFPVFAVLLLGMLWGTTRGLIKLEGAGAERAAVASSRELVETYEAQVVRALREIDQTLKFVKFAYELKGAPTVLRDLKARALLPPDLLFVVSIADRKGDVVASTRPSAIANVADQESFQVQRQSDALSVGRPRRSPGSAEWILQFSRRLDAADGTFAGVVMVVVDAAYFVSGYEQSKLGEHGVLGILGTDGVFRARRTGDAVSAGDLVDYRSTVTDANQRGTKAPVATNSWDGVRRYTSARQLHDFPLAVIVGLSEDEQLAGAHRSMRRQLWWAAAASVLLIAVIAVLGRLSWRLVQSRLREGEAKVAHAERVEYLAYHDGLTTLPNRSLFSKLLIQDINQAHRYNGQLAVLFLDLDRFKQINDTLGHDAGDLLLQEVGRRLKGCLRESDAVARVGGDEFVVLLPALEEEKQVAMVAKKILTSIAMPFALTGQEFRVTASVGISVYPQDGQDEQTLMKNADIAMYQAKAEGKNNFQFYSDKLNANSLERLALESSLRRALERNEFQLHYQAKKDLRTGRITGVEALLRWQHEDLGTVAPTQFLPLAEDIGLIVPIGKWMLKTACLQTVAWQNQGLNRLTMAVNLLAGQFFNEHLLHDIASILEVTGMDSQLLELEITESMLMHNVEKTMQVLAGLKRMGVRIAMDDFGTGYSSLSTLKQFPLDTIKIDGSFIRDVASSAQDKGMTTAIIAMGRTLRLTVVAEGVETKEQADFLREQSCDEFQGLYFNKPMLADQFTELLRAQMDAEPA